MKQIVEESPLDPDDALDVLNLRLAALTNSPTQQIAEQHAGALFAVADAFAKVGCLPVSTAHQLILSARIAARKRINQLSKIEVRQ